MSGAPWYRIGEHRWYTAPRLAWSVCAASSAIRPMSCAYVNAPADARRTRGRSVYAVGGERHGGDADGAGHFPHLVAYAPQMAAARPTGGYYYLEEVPWIATYSGYAARSLLARRLRSPAATAALTSAPMTPGVSSSGVRRRAKPGGLRLLSRAAAHQLQRWLTRTTASTAS